MRGWLLFATVAQLCLMGGGHPSLSLVGRTSGSAGLRRSPRQAGMQGAVPILRLRGGEDEESSSDSPLEEAVAGLRIGNSTQTNNVNVVFIGHVDSGKSTISGHILYETGGLDERTLDKYEREAKAIGRESWKYAWAMDTTDEERAKGKTQECGRATFKTPLRHYTILDAPGHKNFVPFMIGGASQAEIGVLVVSARQGEFEAGFERGGQTREHAVLAKTSGVGFLVVAVNKMDEVKWDKERFDEVVDKVSPFLKHTGFNLKTQVTFIPIEGLSGINLKDRLDKGVCDWYDGPSLLELLDSLQISFPDPDGELRMTVSDRYRDADLYVLGKIASGTMEKGQTVLALPSNTTMTINTIVVDEVEIDKAVAGDNVQLRIRSVDDEVVKTGSIICSPVERPCPVVYTFECKLNVLNCKNILSAGYQCLLHVHNSCVECTWVEVVSIFDKKLGEISGKRQPFVRPGQQAVIKVEVAEQLCVEKYKDLSALGRFIMREEALTVAIGVITDVTDLGLVDTLATS